MKEKLKRVKCFLLDMDGTIYLDNKPIEGAIDAVRRMREHGRVTFLTNNSSMGRKDYVVKLNKMGFDVKEEDIMTSGIATIDYLKNFYDGKKIYLFGNDLLKDEFEKSGIILTEENPDLCVVGFNTTFTYDILVKLCDFIRAGIPYIATHADINCPTQYGFKPDVGSLISLIKSSTGFSPSQVCGKPFLPMGDAVERMTGLDHYEIAMVGDRIATDMMFALNNGYVSVLVLSGEASRDDIEHSGYKVNYVLGSIADWDKD